MAVRVTHSLHDFAADIARTPATEMREMQKVVRDVGRRGLTIARSDAARKADAVARFYPRAMTLDVNAPTVGADGSSWSAVYGPDINRKQGVLDLEHGRGRQSTPHLSLALSADAVGPLLSQRVHDVYSEVFW